MNPSELLGVVIRQGGLRFTWDRERVVYVREPHGQPVGRLEVGTGGRATLDEVHDAIDVYCAEHGLLGAGDWRI